MKNGSQKTRKHRSEWGYFGLRYEWLSLQLKLACRLAKLGARWAASSSTQMKRIILDVPIRPAHVLEESKIGRYTDNTEDSKERAA